MALLLLAALAIGLYGIQRSLWLDETWVANSVLQPTLSGMFHYPDWLQTTPPLFLLMVRGVVETFGLSNLSLRMVPLALSLAAAAALLAAASRLASPAFAVLAGGLLAFHPTAIEYSHTLKQYSGEMAASAVILWLTVLYLQEPSRRRFYWLLAAFALALPLAYSTAFLLPGAAIAVSTNGGIRRSIALVLTSGAVLSILYLYFIRPNLSPRLRVFWIQNAQGLTPGLLIALLFCIAVLAIVRSWTIFIALLPCLLLAAANALEWYPNSPRTRLFVLPGFFLAATIAADKLLGRRRAGVTAAWITTVVFIAAALWNQVEERRNRPEEDLAGAVRYLRRNVKPSDRILVHASVKEGFKLYTRMQGWDHPPAIYGETGYPCCRPVAATIRRTVLDDIHDKMPRGFDGRIWVFYSTRPAQWDYIGVDEGQFWRRYLVENGCSGGPTVEPPDLDISAFDCSR